MTKTNAVAVHLYEQSGRSACDYMLVRRTERTLCLSEGVVHTFF